MKCRFCKKEFEDSSDCLLKKNALIICSEVCRSRDKSAKRKIRLANLGDRVCQHPKCSNKVMSISKDVKTCSNKCGQALRELKRVSYFGETIDLNSSSNPLIRLTNKFLQMPIS